MSAIDDPQNNSDLDDNIICLKYNDVIFGRGSGANNHKGNIRFRLLVDKQSQEYKVAIQRQTKSEIARKILKQVKDWNGRFLMKSDNTWVLADEKIVITKVKATLRKKCSNHGNATLTDYPTPQIKLCTGKQGSSSNVKRKKKSHSSGNNGKSDYYVEEIAWRYVGDTAPVTSKMDKEGNLLPLLAPAPLPKLPQTGKCTWTFDEQSCVILGRFWNRGESLIVYDDDREFLFDMMERNDITVITEGHADGLNHNVWNLEFIKKWQEQSIITIFDFSKRNFLQQRHQTRHFCMKKLMGI